MRDFFDFCSDPESVTVLLCLFVFGLGCRNLGRYIVSLYFARKCNYDCDTCRNWDCEYKRCQDRKKKSAGKGAKTT